VLAEGREGEAVKAIAFYVISFEVLCGGGIIAVFWPDEPCGLAGGLARVARDLGCLLWCRHPGSRAKRARIAPVPRKAAIR
jgi:hypothetical protein